MARPIEFERDDVLRKSMKVFWQQGYKATSVKDIVHATKVQPGSIYGAFGNKKKLFMASLEYYSNDMNNLVKKTLYADTPPLENINNFFLGMSQHSEKNGINNGCLLVNTLLELSTIDQETKEIVCKIFADLESRFTEVLNKAKEEGAIASNKTPEMLAKMLIVGMFGLRVYSKANPSQAQQKIIIDALISTLKQ